MLYFDGSSGINPYLERVEEAGGEVLVPRSFVNESVGHWAAFSDLDGNLLAFYEPPQ
jgi:predicted enzyme related to lactoylglutathione lyase